MSRRNVLIFSLLVASFIFIRGRNRGLWFRSVGTYEIKITLYSESSGEPEPVESQSIGCYYNASAMDEYYDLGDVPGFPLACRHSALVTDKSGEIVFRAKRIRDYRLGIKLGRSLFLVPMEELQVGSEITLTQRNDANKYQIAIDERRNIHQDPDVMKADRDFVMTVRATDWDPFDALFESRQWLSKRDSLPE